MTTAKAAGPDSGMSSTNQAGDIEDIDETVYSASVDDLKQK